jgi:hypothetical protein
VCSVYRVVDCDCKENRSQYFGGASFTDLQIHRSGFDSRRYHIFWVVGLERGPLSLVSTIEELLGRKK